MKTPLEILAQFNIPTDNPSTAALFVMVEDDDISNQRSGMGRLTKDGYETAISQVFGLTDTPVFDNIKIARIYFAYTVQETVRNFTSGIVPDMEWLWNDVNEKAMKFINTNPWSVKEYTNNLDDSGVEKLDAAGKPKQRKGAKKELAKKVWDDNADKQDTLDRSGWIALLMEQVGLTKSGASTYYANLRKGTQQ